MIDSIETQEFQRKLAQYLTSKGMHNVKIPQIGGRELDFHKLYQAVTMRGGAQVVSNNKLWKEIVNEFGLPSTCTSASFTLRNHYKKYLLGFEQRYFFNNQQDVLPELPPGRVRNRHNDEQGENSDSDKEGGQNSNPEVNQNSMIGNQSNLMGGEQKIPPGGSTQNRLSMSYSGYNQGGNSYGGHDSSNRLGGNGLRNELQSTYGRLDQQEEMFYIKKTKTFVNQNDLRRIQLAFDSRIKEELCWAVNSLLLYSASQSPQPQLNFDSFQPNLLDSIVNFIQDTIKNVPSLLNATKIKEIIFKNDDDVGNVPPETRKLIKQLNMLENYNYSVSKVIQYNRKENLNESPISLLRKRKSEGISKFYEATGEVFLLQLLRTIFLVLRNASYVKSNEIPFLKHQKLLQICIQLFIYNCDTEVSQYSIQIISNLSKNMSFSITLVPEYSQFLDRIFEVLSNEQNQEAEPYMETLKNLISIQENESIIEERLPQYIDTINKLLICTNPEIRESVMEFLRMLSDLQMLTQVALAREPKLIMRIIGLLGSGVGVKQDLTNRSNERMTQLAALTLHNIAVAPASRLYLLPYEKDIFLIASTDQSISELLANILSELNSFQYEDLINEKDK